MIDTNEMRSKGDLSLLEIHALCDEIDRLRAALAPILAHADAPDTAPPLRISVRQARKMKEKIDGRE